MDTPPVPPPRSKIDAHPNPWDALTVALIRRQHERGELSQAVIDAMMSAIGLPVSEGAALAPQS
jgi:hypothetical protein